MISLLVFHFETREHSRRLPRAVFLHRTSGWPPGCCGQTSSLRGNCIERENRRNSRSDLNFVSESTTEAFSDKKRKGELESRHPGTEETEISRAGNEENKNSKIEALF